MSNQENKQTTEEVERVKIERQRVNLLYASMIGVDLIIMQDFISLGVPDTPSFISVLAFAVGLPFLATGIYVNNDPKVNVHRSHWTSPTWGTVVAILLFGICIFGGFLASLIGLIAAFWHVSWIAGVVVLASGIVATTTLGLALAFL